MKLFGRIVYFVQWLYGDTMPTPEEWSMKHGAVTSPDMLIAGGIVESFALQYDDWARNKIMDNPKAAYMELNNGIKTGKWHLFNEKKSIVVLFSVEQYYDLHYTYDAQYKFSSYPVFVNGEPLNKEASQYIYDNWTKLRKVKLEAEQIAAKAKADMEANERKWNLAESVLGMKRNEHGALVPKVEVTECSSESPSIPEESSLSETFTENFSSSSKVSGTVILTDSGTRFSR